MPARAVQLGQTGLCQRAEHGLIRGGVDMVAFLEVAERHAVRGAQTKHKVLVLPLEVGDFLLVPHGGRAVCKGGDVARERTPAPVNTYDYYDRDKYLTNIGYDYSAIGKGLDLGENVWPNSDLKMMQKTVDDYINSDSFSVYYMTVSGHGAYSYNTMSERNADLVKDLKYSDEVKGYLAANIELDKAMKYLLARLSVSAPRWQVLP